jgi:hypothetical protein
VALVRRDVSEECITSIFRVKIISKLGTMLAVTGNCSMLWRIIHYMRKKSIEWDVLHDSLILVTLMMKAACSFKTSVLTRATWPHIPEDDNLHSLRC